MNKIITFHAVQDAAWFDKVLTIIKRKYIFISIHELESYYYDAKQFNNVCHITIDDGDKSFYETIYPILKKKKIPATLFVSPKMCKEEKNFWFQEIRNFDINNFKLITSNYLKIDFKQLSPFSLNDILKNLRIEEIWQIIKLYKNHFNLKDEIAQNITFKELIEIDRDGLVAIGAHTINHPILANENDEICKKEIIDSFNELQYLLGHKINYFAFPNGLPNVDFGQREVDTLKSINCKLAFSTQINNFCKNDDPLCIPRFGFSFGSKNFIKSKLFLGQYWEIGKKIKGISEKVIRLKLRNKKLIKHIYNE
jgi:peptidoglycan/xylan/chitin deacetylase (PgdA/CDA1 family)